MWGSADRKRLGGRGWTRGYYWKGGIGSERVGEGGGVRVWFNLGSYYYSYCYKGRSCGEIMLRGVDPDRDAHM